jgi:hypothetical protein
VVGRIPTLVPRRGFGGSIGLDRGGDEWRDEGSDNECGEGFLVRWGEAEDVREGVQRLEIGSGELIWTKPETKWNKRLTWDLRTAGAFEARASSARHLVRPDVSSAFWLPARPVPAPPTSMRTSEMTRPALMTFCSDHDWNAKAESEEGVRAVGCGNRRSGARSGMHEVSRK